MKDMRLTAQQLAEQGRYGDTMLLHVSPAEVEGIASLIPGGLTTNPVTGLPEAFFFLPFLASLFGAAAPAAAAATGAAAAGTIAATAAPALAAGVGAGTLAATAAPVAAAAAPAALGGISSLAAPATISASMLSAPAIAAPAAGSLVGGGGLGSLAGGIGADAIGSSTLGTGVAPAATAAAPAVAPAVPAVPAVAAPAPVTLAASPETAATLAPTSSATTAGGGADAWAGLRAATAAPTVNTAVTTTPVANGITTLTDKIGGLFSMKNLPGLAIGMQALGSLFPQGGGGGKEEKGKSRKEVDSMKYRGGATSFPTRAQANDVRYGEHNYFPNYQYANGGIVSLAGGGPVDPQMQPPQDMSFPLNGVPGSTDEAPMLEDIPSSNFPTSQIGAEPEPLGEPSEPSTNNDRELIAQTVEAIQGKIADPNPILLAFVQEFGEPALQDLAKRVKAMPKSGGPAGGDGMSDSIPAMIDGEQPAALSQGEYVIPADVVSGMGNGSTDAGGQQLDSLVSSVRQQRTGSPQQPPQLNTGGLINGYANGGIVGLAKGGKVYQPDPWTWGDFLNPFSESPRSYVESGPPGGAERGLNAPPYVVKPYPSDDLEDYGPGLMPEFIDEWIPSVQGYTTTGDWFATQPEIRRAQAKKRK